MKTNCKHIFFLLRNTCNMVAMDKAICLLYIEVKNIYCKGNTTKYLGDKYLEILLTNKPTEL